jgi:pimeloyl-ACP methyl ester carboxylesterase
MLETREGYKAFGDRKMLASSPAMYAAMLQSITAATGVDRLADLSRIAVPTLVLVGEEDAPFRKPSARMAEAIPGAELVVLPDGGHSPQFETPDLWWKALTTFLDRL